MEKLILVAPDPELCMEWKRAFDAFESVEIHHGRFESLPAFDCMVSAANSFGLMDGGVDLAIVNFFGAQLERDIQSYILANYFGEQPIGTSFLMETRHKQHPWVAHTPTMRVPMNIQGTDYVYLAMKAMLTAVWQHNQQADQAINIVACPGLGTGTGRVTAKEAARQMALAYKNYLYPLTHIDWRAAGKRQNEIKYGFNLT